MYPSAMDKIIQAKAVIKNKGMILTWRILSKKTNNAIKKKGMIKALNPNKSPINNCAHRKPTIPPLLAIWMSGLELYPKLRVL